VGQDGQRHVVVGSFVDKLGFLKTLLVNPHQSST
jgi:hypothetical protein